MAQEQKNTGTCDFGMDTWIFVNFRPNLISFLLWRFPNFFKLVKNYSTTSLITILGHWGWNEGSSTPRSNLHFIVSLFLAVFRSISTKYQKSAGFWWVFIQLSNFRLFHDCRSLTFRKNTVRPWSANMTLYHRPLL